MMASSSSSEAESALDLLNLVNVNNKVARKRRRRYWVHPYWHKKAKEYGAFSIFKELNMYPERFQNFYRMTKETFYFLLEKIAPEISKRDTNFRLSISPEERLLITLRYFATGASFKTLSYYFLRGHSTIRNIVAETAEAIWKILQPDYIKMMAIDDWLIVADRYWNLWNLPNCVGSIDGKHIRIKAPPRSGSAFYNYKGYFSIVLLGVADADGLFLSISVGEYGRNSDGRVLRESAFGKALYDGQLQLPEPTPLPGEPNHEKFPFCFTSDEAFPLTNHIMKPFARRQLTDERRIFNYRLSRGRKSVKCAFGMMTSKFRLLETPICCNVDKIDTIIQAICVLHNFIKMHDGTFSVPVSQTIGGNNISGALQESSQNNRQRPTYSAIDLRNRLCDFFLKPEGALSYQDRYRI